jgi:hypothetical protein
MLVDLPYPAVSPTSESLGQRTLDETGVDTFLSL